MHSLPAPIPTPIPSLFLPPPFPIPNSDPNPASPMHEKLEDLHETLHGDWHEQCMDFSASPLFANGLANSGHCSFFHTMQNGSANRTIKRFFHAYVFFSKSCHLTNWAQLSAVSQCRALAWHFNQRALASAVGTANRTQMKKNIIRNSKNPRKIHNRARRH